MYIYCPQKIVIFELPTEKAHALLNLMLGNQTAFHWEDHVLQITQKDYCTLFFPIVWK